MQIHLNAGDKSIHLSCTKTPPIGRSEMRCPCDANLHFAEAVVLHWQRPSASSSNGWRWHTVNHTVYSFIFWGARLSASIREICQWL
jgi:hypothetical protein